MKKKTFFCIDAHTCGNPVRVVAGGGPYLKGTSMLQKRAHFLAEYDWIRTGLMFEPRGHDMMSGSILLPPQSDEDDLEILFIETSGCLPMCGHGTIGTVTAAIEHQLVFPKTPGELRLQTPAGPVTAKYQLEGNKVTSVQLINVPSFLHSRDLSVTSPELGELTVDVAYGGNFYAIVDPQENFSGIENFTAAELIRFSPEIRRRLNDSYTFIHPEDQRIAGLSHIQWTGATLKPDSSARNAVFYGDKAIDRSPCGTGTSARMAQWAARDKLSVGSTFVHESFIGSTFTGRVEKSTQVGQYPAIIPSIEGWAHVTGTSTIVIDENDPYAFGFQVI